MTIPDHGHRLRIHIQGLVGRPFVPDDFAEIAAIDALSAYPAFVEMILLAGRFAIMPLSDDGRAQV
ncbi:hypothetical protein [Mesorhizobium sp.]|uniref:hypothetical protein n=1 Tax=Mesorhizobium sp. TaxID=1871066 RepID=UPI0025D55378|nr:hypothetical protein [Mesorhizobium sp.]